MEQTSSQTEAQPQDRGSLRGLVRFFRRAMCSHRFDYDDLLPRKGELVTWPCWKCGKVFKAECGLDIIYRGQVERKKSNK